MFCSLLLFENSVGLSVILSSTLARSEETAKDYLLDKYLLSTCYVLGTEWAQEAWPHAHSSPERTPVGDTAGAKPKWTFRGGSSTSYRLSLWRRLLRQRSLLPTALPMPSAPRHCTSGPSLQRVWLLPHRRRTLYGFFSSSPGNHGAELDLGGCLSGPM